MRDLLIIFKALGDPNRIRILKILEVREMCVCEITEVLKISQPGVSKHLKILETAGLLGFRKEGLWVNYFLNFDYHNPYSKDILTQLKGWLNQDPEIARLKEEAKVVNRENLRAGTQDRSCSCASNDNKSLGGACVNPS
jgi:ArsR family transcriptional regulator